MTIKPTAKQIEIYNIIKELIEADIRPTYDVLVKRTGNTRSYLFETVMALERKGLIWRTPGAPGGIRISDDY